jgi:hypothetical protein
MGSFGIGLVYTTAERDESAMAYALPTDIHAIMSKIEPVFTKKTAGLNRMSNYGFTGRTFSRIERNWRVFRSLTQTTASLGPCRAPTTFLSPLDAVRKNTIFNKLQ